MGPVFRNRRGAPRKSRKKLPEPSLLLCILPKITLEGRGMHTALGPSPGGHEGHCDTHFSFLLPLPPESPSPSLRAPIHSADEDPHKTPPSHHPFLAPGCPHPEPGSHHQGNAPPAQTCLWTTPQRRGSASLLPQPHSPNSSPLPPPYRRLVHSFGKTRLSPLPTHKCQEVHFPSRHQPSKV